MVSVSSIIAIIRQSLGVGLPTMHMSVKLLSDFVISLMLTRVDAKLSLSTASPSIGGVPPELDTCQLTLHHLGSASSAKSRRPVILGASFGMPSTGSALPSLPSVPLARPQAQVTEGLSSSVFEIDASATIPSDNTAHKVHTYIHTHTRTYTHTHTHIHIHTHTYTHMYHSYTYLHVHVGFYYHNQSYSYI